MARKSSGFIAALRHRAGLDASATEGSFVGSGPRPVEHEPVEVHPGAPLIVVGTGRSRRLRRGGQAN
ncbi:MAG TPA: hypothetical protein VMU75_01435 [Acidimicrobiales bacterium]|nr:hypothetical protein [Acidimicrobiales bacterium]